MDKYILLGAILWPSVFCFAEEAFIVERLPQGKSVTLPMPATVLVSLKNRVSLQATDTAQSLKLSSVHMEKGQAKPIRLGIYDRNLERVKYVDVKPGLPFLYTFNGLDHISLIPEQVDKNPDRAIRLKIESNKPLEVGR